MLIFAQYCIARSLEHIGNSAILYWPQAWLVPTRLLASSIFKLTINHYKQLRDQNRSYLHS